MATKKSLADLANAFAKKTDSESTGSATWKLFFPFWKADLDTTSVIRFLPDLDENNHLAFLVENKTHNLVVNGRKEVVACGKMYGDSCPICDQSQRFYDEKSPDYNKELGYKYYRKLSYIGQVLVQDTPIEHNQEQIVKLIEFGPKIFKQIQAAFKSGDLDNPPYDLKGGHDFRINKTKSGEYADYGTSTFKPKASDVSDDLIEQIELFDLAAYRAPRVDSAVLEGMLMADLSGGGSAPAPREEAPAPKASKPAKAEEDADNEAEDTPAPSEKKLSVAEQIRARQAARQAAASSDDGE